MGTILLPSWVLLSGTKMTLLFQSMLSIGLAFFHFSTHSDQQTSAR
jgi:hypothetical protein